MLYILLLLPVGVLSFQKFDLYNLPIDLRPVQDLVGRWEYETIGGNGQENIPYGRVLEFGIDPLPQFGARSLNYTAITYDTTQKSSILNSSKVIHYEYGYLPVKNKTKLNPQVLTAFLTTGSEGYSMIEFGLVDDNIIRLDMNKFLVRSFETGFASSTYQIYEMSREFRINGRRLEQNFNAKTNYGPASFTVYYGKTTP